MKMLLPFRVSADGLPCSLRKRKRKTEREKEKSDAFTFGVEKGKKNPPPKSSLNMIKAILSAGKARPQEKPPISAALSF